MSEVCGVKLGVYVSLDGFDDNNPSLFLTKIHIVASSQNENIALDLLLPEREYSLWADKVHDSRVYAVESAVIAYENSGRASPSEVEALHRLKVFLNRHWRELRRMEYLEQIKHYEDMIKACKRLIKSVTEAPDENAPFYDYARRLKMKEATA